jgi:aryl-alcohol dehydrogenase-like predicted oxidoreductase
MEWPAKDDSMLADSFPTQYIIKQTERSLRNLNREYVDLQQFHVWNDKWAGQDEWKEAVYRLKKDGKVRYFGISINDHEPANGIEAGKTGLIDCFQVIFNLFDQAPMDELLPFCLKNNIAVLARVPLDEGGLTGNINSETEFPKGDWRHHYFRGDRKKQVADRVTAIQAITGQHCSTPAESALRFIVSFDAVTSVIPGMRSEKNLLSNMNAIERGKLPDDIIEELKTQRWIRNFYK